jgi:8-oxo-dGTP diphosphatase
MGSPPSKLIRVVAGLIFRDGQLLVCQRRRDAAFALKWEFPGGKIEAGERPEQALARELKEELAIDADLIEPLCELRHQYENGPRVELRFFQVRRYRGEISNQVFEKIAWSPLANLPEFDFLEGDLPLVAKLVAGQVHLSENRLNI